MRRVVIASAFAAAALFGAPALAQSAVVGEWAVVAATAQGDFESTMTVSEADGGYAIAFQDPPMADGQPMPPATISDIVVDGGSFSFKRSFTTAQGTLDFAYAGAVDGDALTGTATGSIADMPIEVALTGTRK